MFRATRLSRAAPAVVSSMILSTSSSSRSACVAPASITTALCVAQRTAASSSSSKLSPQDVDTSGLNHMYWDDDVLLPYLLSMMAEGYGDEFGGDSLSHVPHGDSALLRDEFLK